MSQSFQNAPTHDTRPRRLVHRGVVVASGFWFVRALVPERIARERILELWRPGAQVERFEDGLLLRLPSPMTVRADSAPATPLVERETLGGKALAAAPFSPEEWQHLAPDARGVVVVARGEAVVLSGGASEDPAGWLHPGDWALGVAQSLGAEMPLPVLLQPLDFNAREKLEGVPAADARSIEVMQSLQRRREEQNARAAATPSAGGNSGWWPRALSGLLPLGEAKWSGARPLFGVPIDDPALNGALSSLISLAWLAPLFRLPSGAAASSSPPARNGRGAEAPSQAPSDAALAGDGWRRALAHMAMLLRLGQVIGRKQAAYIGRMMQMFENGDWDEALRHAIPLGGESEGSAPPALGTPRPRDGLQISPGLMRATSSLGFGPDLSERLRFLYRRAFEQLKERNRTEEAAFVLAELLEASEEAVAFLEAHGKLRLAAEMAEARRLESGLVVRQWFIAGERERAVRFARRSGAFADAVARLERGGHGDEADSLRVLWAESLAEAGWFGAAVEAVWPVESARTVARDWIERGVASGGAVGARLLARHVALEPDRREAWQEKIETLLDGEEPEDAVARHAFSRALGSRPDETSRAATRMMARAAVRSLARDTAAGLVVPEAHDYRRLLDLAEDAALRADAATLPAAPLASTSDTASGPLSFTIDASDATGVPVLDAALLPDGSLVAALGESGARLLSRDGRTRAVLPEPAHRLVMADSGLRALALAPRGEAVRVSHLDLAAWRAQHWDEAALTVGADSYDGSQWLAAHDNELFAIDVQAEHPGALWTSGDTGGRIVSVARGESSVSALVYASGTTDEWGNPVEPWEKWEVWRFDGSPLVLRERRAAWQFDPHAFEPQRTLTPDGRLLYAARQIAPQTNDSTRPAEADPTRPILFGCDGHTVTLSRESIGQTPVASITAGLWIAVTARDENGMTCYLLDDKMLQVRTMWRLCGASRLTARFAGEDLILCDDLGRLLVFDCLQRQLRRDLRVA